MDIFEEQNLDIPETWDEFMELCGKLKDAGIQPLEESYKDTGMAGHYRGGAMAALFPDGALWLAECAQDPEKNLLIILTTEPLQKKRSRSWITAMRMYLEYRRHRLWRISQMGRLP